MYFEYYELDFIYRMLLRVDRTCLTPEGNDKLSDFMGKMIMDMYDIRLGSDDPSDWDCTENNGLFKWKDTK